MSMKWDQNMSGTGNMGELTAERSSLADAVTMGLAYIFVNGKTKSGKEKTPEQIEIIKELASDVFNDEDYKDYPYSDQIKLAEANVRLNLIDDILKSYGDKGMSGVSGYQTGTIGVDNDFGQDPNYSLGDLNSDSDKKMLALKQSLSDELGDYQLSKENMKDAANDTMNGIEWDDGGFN